MIQSQVDWIKQDITLPMIFNHLLFSYSPSISK